MSLRSLSRVLRLPSAHSVSESFAKLDITVCRRFYCAGDEGRGGDAGEGSGQESDQEASEGEAPVSATNITSDTKEAGQAAAASSSTAEATPTAADDQASDAPASDGGASSPKDAEARMASPSAALAWPEFMTLWGDIQHTYMAKQEAGKQAEARERWSNDTVKKFDSEGNVEAAYDATDIGMLDTRVWLHMYEGKDGKLLPSFCEKTGSAQYMYDLIGFADWRVEQNALLSDEAKCLMFKLWKSEPEVWTDVALSHVFKIRVQRTIAILKIKEEEFQQAEAATVALNELQQLFGLEAQPTVEQLRGEKSLYSQTHLTGWFEPWLAFYELMPRMVHPESGGVTEAEATEGAEEGVPEVEDKEEEQPDQNDKRVKLSLEQAERVVELHNQLAHAANCEAKQIATHEDLWKCAYNHGSGERFVPFLTTMPAFAELPTELASEFDAGEYEKFVERESIRQDQEEIAVFKRNLAWNLGETGQSIQREARKRGEPGSTVPSKPEKGWPILVQPLHEGGVTGKAFVAEPDATRRPLTADEDLYLRYFKRQPKIFSRPRRHAPYTNKTLHMFTQKKPNNRHDIYNPQYRGNSKRLKPTSGPSKQQQRRSRIAAHDDRRNLERNLAGTRL